jgi:hypothetical protein
MRGPVHLEEYSIARIVPVYDVSAHLVLWNIGEKAGHFVLRSHQSEIGQHQVTTGIQK